jgi:hypothetical protein
MEFFKYNSLISTPLFTVILLLLIRKKPDFSFTKQTVSKAIFFLNRPLDKIIFRFNFLLKSLLDLGFALYLINYFQVLLISPLALPLLLSVIFFGSLAFFIEGKFPLIHKINTYCSGILWIIAQIHLSYLTQNFGFIYFTWILSSTILILTLIFMINKKTNILVQASCIFLLYFWLTIFIFRYL